MVEQGSHFRMHGKRVVRAWQELLGQRALRLSDHTRLAEVIVAAIQVNEGAAAEAVTASWGGAASVVARAVGELGCASAAPGGGVVQS